MRLNMEEGFLKQITTEQVRQNLALLKAEEIEIPKKWVLEMVNTIEALQQENEQLKANALLDVVNSDIVKSYDGSALERADQYIERLEAERDEFQRRLTGEVELHAQQGAEITRLEEENEQLKAQLDAMSILSDEYAKRLKLQEENEQLRAQVVRMSDSIQKYILSVEKQYSIEDRHKCPICGIFTKTEYCHICITKELINAMSNTEQDYHNPVDVEALKQARETLYKWIKFKDKMIIELLVKIDKLNAICRGALENISEYWNRDNNEKAMEDACWHAIETAQEALAEIDKAIGVKEDE